MMEPIRIIHYLLYCEGETMQHVHSVTQVVSTPQFLCIHDLLKAQAEHTPDALAILAPGRALSN
jgi:hypothetical protein